MTEERTVTEVVIERALEYARDWGAGRSGQPPYICMGRAQLADCTKEFRERMGVGLIKWRDSKEVPDQLMTHMGPLRIIAIPVDSLLEFGFDPRWCDPATPTTSYWRLGKPSPFQW